MKKYVIIRIFYCFICEIKNFNCGVFSKGKRLKKIYFW